VGGGACLEDDLEQVAPRFGVLKLLSSRHGEFLCKLDFFGFLIVLDQTFGHDRSRCENARQLGSQKVALLARESGVAVDVRVQVAGQHVLDQPRALDVLGLAVGQLDPVV